MDNKNLASVFIPVVALVIGVGSGFILGKSAQPEHRAQKSAMDEARSSRRVVHARSGGGASRNNEVRGTRVKSLAQAMELPGQNSRLRALMDYYEGLPVSEFQNEAKKLEDLPWNERIMVGNLLFARWGEKDPTAAMAYTQTMGFSGMFVRGTVMQSWAAKFPEEAAQYYTEHPAEFRMSRMMGGRSRFGGSMAGTIATEWARQDQSAALAWAKSLEGQDQGAALKNVLSESAKEDPAKAAEILSTLTDSDSKKGAQNAVAYEWGKKDWAEAQAWIASLPSDEQASAMSQALRGLAKSDPSVAAEKVALIPDGAEKDRAMEGIARQWGKNDPESAATWLVKEGSESAQTESIGNVVSSWVRQDPASALSFVNNQPEGGVRDRAVSAYVRANQLGNISENLALAETIGDSRTRSRAIGMTVAGWMREDPEAAKDYLKSNKSLSESDKRRINRWIR